MFSPEELTGISIRTQHCPNPACLFYKKKLAGNVTIHSRGKKRLKCKSCGQTWVAHRHSVEYGLRTDVAKINTAIQLLKNGVSIRKIARQIDVSPTTIHRWKERFRKYFSIH